MEELEYSPLLRRLIEKATELDGGPNHKLTAEGFIGGGRLLCQRCKRSGQPKTEEHAEAETSDSDKRSEQYCNRLHFACYQ